MRYIESVTRDEKHRVLIDPDTIASMEERPLARFYTVEQTVTTDITLKAGEHFRIAGDVDEIIHAIKLARQIPDNGPAPVIIKVMAKTHVWKEPKREG